MRERIRRVLVVLWLVAWTSACAAPPADGIVSDPSDFEPDRGRTDVRVALAFAAPSVTFEATGDVRVFAEGDRWRGSAGAYHATVRAGELVLTAPSGGRVEAKSTIDLRAADPAPWRFDGDRFAGSLTVRRNDDGTVSLVNTLPVETYLRGVVPWEIGRPGEDARAAVEAQAVAARTYTYARLGRWEEYGFDLHADVRDQVYRGLSGTAPICDEAIRATAHRVAVRDGALIRAYYSSTSGGHTATLVDVWHREGAPYLIGKRDADARGRSWCRTSPHFRWTESWSAKELGDIVREHLSSELDRSLAPEDIGVLQRIDVVARDHSGRVQRLAVVTDVDRFEIWAIGSAGCCDRSGRATGSSAARCSPWRTSSATVVWWGWCCAVADSVMAWACVRPEPWPAPVPVRAQARSCARTTKGSTSSTCVRSTGGSSHGERPASGAGGPLRPRTRRRRTRPAGAPATAGRVVVRTQRDRRAAIAGVDPRSRRPVA